MQLKLKEARRNTGLKEQKAFRSFMKENFVTIFLSASTTILIHILLR